MGAAYTINWPSSFFCEGGPGSLKVHKERAIAEVAAAVEATATALARTRTERKVCHASRRASGCKFALRPIHIFRGEKTMTPPRCYCRARASNYLRGYRDRWKAKLRMT